MDPFSAYPPSYCLSLIKIFVSSLDNVHRMCPEEHNVISKHMKQMGDGFLNFIVTRGVEESISSLINTTNGWMRGELLQGKVIDRMELAMKEVKENEIRPTLPDPGDESKWVNRRRKPVRIMGIHRDFLSQVCGAFSENDVLRIANVEFIPREYMIESTSTNITAYLRHILPTMPRSRC
eukprot:TRINITY_DN325_c1_g1_i1.p1 TRINITY_DN325_c1_g1~~TRINITY_DN325_c1_g1_i1.p1  ORF type:complete len:179 (-),score=14.68 TRINITY_DN325_c1_g1_i1:273-809(-)